MQRKIIESFLFCSVCSKSNWENKVEPEQILVWQNIRDYCENQKGSFWSNILKHLAVLASQMWKIAVSCILYYC